MSLPFESRRKVAEFLLRIKAIELQPNDPFTWASGRRSPIYCDNRKIYSHPTVRTHIRELCTAEIRSQYGSPSAIAGVATGGIPLGALVAQELGIPFVYVRSEVKAHGMGNQIEGDLKMVTDVVVIEDLVSTGKSSLSAVDALRAAGVKVKGLVAVFTYGFPDAFEAFEAKGCPWSTLSDFPTLLDQAIASNHVTEAQRELLASWSVDPLAWSNAQLST